MKHFSAIFAVVTICELCTVAIATIPGQINLQGMLKDGSGNPVADGTYSVVFTIYDAPVGGNVLWTETQLVSTASGLFTVLLGFSATIPDTTFNDSSRYLGIQVGSDPEMTPRQRLSSVGYSYVSSQWSSLGENIFRPNGNVGIGTTAFSNAGIPELMIKAINSSNAAYMGVVSSDGSSSAGIRSGIGGDGSLFTFQNNIQFGATTGNGTTGFAEKMRITSGGNVGIGTTNPIYPLHVNGSSFSIDHYTGGVSVGNGSSYGYLKGDEFRFQTSYGYAAGPVKITVRGNFANDALDNQDALFLSFQRQDLSDYDDGYPFALDIGQFGATKLRLDKNGNIGIGTTSPTSKLYVAGDTRLGAGIDYGVSTVLSVAPGTVTFDAPGVAGGRLRIDGSTGNVGIGTTSPAYELDVAGTGNFSSFSNAVIGSTTSILNTGAAIKGVATSTSGGGVGVFGETRGTGIPEPDPNAGSAIGVYGLASSPTTTGGATFGVLGRNLGGKAAGYSRPAGVLGEGLNTSNLVDGVQGITYSPAFGSAGVYGAANADAGRVFGVEGATKSTTDGAAGVRGHADATVGQVRGVWGSTNSTTDGSAGVLGAAGDGGVGVRGEESAGGTGFAIYSDGDMKVAGTLDVSSTTGAFIVPRMTTAQRNALTAVNGMIIYNTTTNQFNFRENGAWVTK